MNNEPSLLEQVYAPIFEDSLLREIEQKSMLITATAGQGLIRMGQPITVVPMVFSGTLKNKPSRQVGTVFSHKNVSAHLLVVWVCIFAWFCKRSVTKLNVGAAKYCSYIHPLFSKQVAHFFSLHNSYFIAVGSCE